MRTCRRLMNMMQANNATADANIIMMIKLFLLPFFHIYRINPEVDTVSASNEEG